MFLQLKIIFTFKNRREWLFETHASVCASISAFTVVLKVRYRNPPPTHGIKEHSHFLKCIFRTMLSLFSPVYLFSSHSLFYFFLIVITIFSLVSTQCFFFQKMNNDSNISSTNPMLEAFLSRMLKISQVAVVFKSIKDEILAFFESLSLSLPERPRLIDFENR